MDTAGKMKLRIICAPKAALYVAFFLVITTFTFSPTDASNPEKLLKPSNPVSESDFTTCDVSYMVVSTIDGKISFLDLHQHGQLAWSIDADSKPLVSSSLANLEVVRNGKKLRLIPALDGAIYQFDGEKVEPIPLSAESLLSSTYQLSDDAMIVGSKSLQSFGINYKTGEVQFVCDSDGCNSNQGQAKDLKNGSDVVVVTRITQIVRSVDMKHGQEKWNFSVGEHLINLPSASAQSRIEDHFEKQNEDLPHMFAPKKDKKCPYSDELGHENFLRLVVPEGKVVALNKQDSSRVAWEYKFNSPIAKAWLLIKGKLHVMNLFTEQHIPSMNTFTFDNIETDSSTQPLLYIGSHEKLLYIQPSPGMEAVLKMYSGRRIGHVFDPNVKVAWKPYLNTASVRTPIFGGNKQHIVEYKKKDKRVESQKNSLAVWHEEYPFDTGYFLYPEFKDSRSVVKTMLVQELQDSQVENSLANFFWTFRKEITVIIAFTVLVSLVIDYLVGKLTFSRRKLILPTDAKLEDSASLIEDDKQSLRTVSETISEEYVSRFETDFDCVQYLGKGGFGVVMEAVNKVDEQHYAVKRIPLPRSEVAKEKVLREVKALAKLEHIGIVRYFNAWVESPPAGWQEKKDLSLKLCETSTYTITDNTTSLPRKKYSKSSLINSVETSDNDDISYNGPRREPNLDTNSDSIIFASEDSAKCLEGSGSGGFSLHPNIREQSVSSDEVEFSMPKRYTKSMKQSAIETEESQSLSRSSIVFSNFSTTSSLDGIQTVDGDLAEDSVVFDRLQSESKISSENLTDSDYVEGLPFNQNKQKEIESNSEKYTKDKREKFFLYIQMQLYQKETLSEWLHNNTLNRQRSELMDIFDQILCAVDYVHNRGLMHRDLKPSNIFFSAEGVVKVGDFGLVTPLSVEEDEDCNHRDLFNSSGHTHTADVGTTLYMSPEQIARKPYNLKVDVFSLGLIFLELWMPFSTQMERVRTLQDAKNHVLPDRFERELPTECQLVKRMTSEDPTLRPNTKEIMEHSLLKDFVSTRFVQPWRTRTISNGSNDQS